MPRTDWSRIRQGLVSDAPQWEDGDFDGGGGEHRDWGCFGFGETVEGKGGGRAGARRHGLDLVGGVMNAAGVEFSVPIG